ncbi:MAG: CoA transferase, partial [Actinomycetes bacterium]
QFTQLCEALGSPNLSEDPRFATNPDRVMNRSTLRQQLESRLAAQTAAAWCAELTKFGIPCGPINDVAAAFTMASSLGLDPIVEIAASADPHEPHPEPIRGVANPVRLSETPPSYRLPPPALGTDVD